MGLKHHGRFPSRLDIEEYRASTTSFFKDNTLIVFGIEFEKISLLELVQSKKAREFLHDAHKLLSTQDLGKAIQVISVAFDEVINDYEARKERITAIHLSFLRFMRWLIVTKNGKALGIVTERDLVRRYSRSTVLENLASYPLITAEPSTTIEKVVDIMLKNGIRKLPIIDERKNYRHSYDI